MDKNLLIKGFKEAVMDMRKNHTEGTYYWYLHTDKNNNNWAIVLGWADGYEDDITDDCLYGTCRINVKVAYQPSNSAMSDYDIDWLMPYDEESGEVYDNEVAIYSDTDLESVIEWLLEFYEDYKEC